MPSIKCVPNEYGTFSMPEQNSMPYEPGECRHTNRFDNNGVLTCKNCGMIYNETTLEWVYHER
jgi:hypothetical protein